MQKHLGISSDAVTKGTVPVCGMEPKLDSLSGCFQIREGFSLVLIVVEDFEGSNSRQSDAWCPVAPSSAKREKEACLV
jgi:hypothetical protein